MKSLYESLLDVDNNIDVFDEELVAQWCTKHESSSRKPVNPSDIKKNGDKLKRLLDKQGKMVLKNIVNRIIYNYKQINKKYYLDSSYERKLLYIKMQKEFQKVCNETIAIEKAMGDEIVPRDEKEVIKTMISKLIHIENNSYQSILDLKRKAKVMKNIKPLIHEKKFKIKKK